MLYEEQFHIQFVQYTQETIIFASSSVDGFYIVLEMNLTLFNALWTDEATYEDWSNLSPQLT
jgi:hypothetical protein